MLPRMSRVSAVRAFSFASTLSPKELAPVLEESGGTVRVAKTQVVAECPGPSWIIAYDFGAITFVGVTDEVRERVMASIQERIRPEAHPPMEEQILIEASEEEKPGVRFDRVVVKEVDRKLVELVSLVTAQSAAMEYYEEDVDLILAGLKDVSEGLAETGKLRAGVRELLRFVGSGMSTHNQVVYTLALLDTPALAWEDETLDRIYQGLRAQLEIADRYRALDHKLNMIQNNFELLVNLTQERRSWWVEVAVAVLVGLEVLLFVYEIFWKR